MLKKNVLINASNLHLGGGVQVAISFINELSRIKSETIEFHVVCSTEVNKALVKAGTDTSKFSSYQVYDVYGFGASSIKFSRLFSGFDAIFTVFGPDYRLGSQKNTLVGFAQPWIVYPDNEVFLSLSLLSKLKIKLKLLVQIFFYKKAGMLVVELPHVKQGVVNRSIANKDRIKVVHNSVSSLYFQPGCWEDVGVEPSKDAFNLGFVGRDYSHKNLKILPEVKAILSRDYSLDVRFFVTLSQKEWAVKSPLFKSSVSTVGELSVAQCPVFYQKMDGVIFPSLLECFSATPLEAMAMERPLFASDRGFVRDVCEDYAYYFDPLSPASAAAVIANYINNIKGFDGERLKEASAYARSFSSAKGRAEGYVRILEQMVI
ncbi:MAG TPA: glycosyltransferase family 4 protein [Oligella sp.]|nr:glycosyltransferase family 4 protein [Oligella sp.]